MQRRFIPKDSLTPLAVLEDLTSVGSVVSSVKGRYFPESSTDLLRSITRSEKKNVSGGKVEPKGAKAKVSSLVDLFHWFVYFIPL